METVSLGACQRLFLGVKSIMRNYMEIYRYMVSDGKDIIGWYFSQVLSTTPSDHLSRICMYTKRTKVFVHVPTMPYGRNMHAT